MSAVPGIVASRRASAPPAPQGWNPADKDADITVSGTGDTVATLVATGSEVGAIRSVTGHTADGDYYAELTVATTGTLVQMLGIGLASATLANYPGIDADARSYYSHTGEKYTNNAGAAYGATYANGDVIGVRFKLNAGNGELTFYKNGVSQGLAWSGGALNSGTWFLMWGPATVGAATRSCTLNTGQSAFASAPSGVTAWG